MTPLMRNIAIISLSLCSVAHAYAGEDERRRDIFRAGGFLAGGFADWMGRDANGRLPGEVAAAKPGASAGLLMTLDVGSLMSLDVEPLRLSVQPEIVYAGKGTRFERDGEYQGVHINMTYLQAGLLLRMEYAAAGRYSPYLLVGPELGLLRSAEFHNGLGDIIDGKADFKSTDLGLIVGLGAMYSLPPWGALGLELRADLGLVSIDGQGDGDELRNAALSLLLVYLY